MLLSSVLNGCLLPCPWVLPGGTWRSGAYQSLSFRAESHLYLLMVVTGIVILGVAGLVFMYVCTHMCRGQRSNSGIIPRAFFLVFLR